MDELWDEWALTLDCEDLSQDMLHESVRADNLAAK